MEDAMEEAAPVPDLNVGALGVCALAKFTLALRRQLLLLAAGITQHCNQGRGEPRP